MNTLTDFLTTNHESISLIVTAISVVMVFYTFYTTRKMVKNRKEAEIKYINKLRVNEEYIKFIMHLEKNSQITERELGNLLLKNQKIFIKSLEQSDQNIQIEVKPALTQPSLENRKAYLSKIVRMASDISNITKTLS